MATNVGDLALRLATFVVFGLGLALPLLALSLLTASRQRAVVRFALERRRTVEVTAGVLLLVVGLADLVENWSVIRIALGG